MEEQFPGLLLQKIKVGIPYTNVGASMDYETAIRVLEAKVMADYSIVVLFMPKFKRKLMNEFEESIIEV